MALPAKQMIQRFKSAPVLQQILRWLSIDGLCGSLIRNNGTGSIPVVTTEYTLVAQLERAPAYEADGWGFEFLRAYQTSNRIV